MRTFEDFRSLSDAIGADLGVSEWREIPQCDIDAFASVTGDDQWIHVDPERAATGPFGTTVAHGYHVLALAPALQDEVVRFDGFGHVINYGLDRVRFPAPCKVGSRVRLHAVLKSVEERGSGSARIELELVFENDGNERPVCAASSILLLAT